MDEETSIRDWLEALPVDAEIAWNDNHIGPGFIHATAGWLDIQVPMAEQDLALNWIWTVDVVEDPDHYDFQGDIWIKTEGYVFIVCDKDKMRLALACYDDGRVGEVPQEEIDHLLSSWGPIIKEGKWAAWLCPFADIERVNQALTALAAKDGRGDITFRYEPEIGPSPLLQEVEKMVEKLETGEATTEPFDFMNPAWMAEHFDMTLEEAEEQVKEIEAGSRALVAENDRIRVRYEKIAHRLLERFSERLGN